MHRTTARSPWGSRLERRFLILIFTIILAVAVSVGGISPSAAQAQLIGNSTTTFGRGVNLADPLVDEQIEQAWHPAYLSLATGDPNLLEHGVYAWPFEPDSLGWNMQSYQDYGGAPYFHHGMDMMKMWIQKNNWGFANISKFIQRL
jgi:hypothetical protein